MELKIEDFNGSAPDAQSAFSDALMLIRNNLSFHYYQADKVLHQGYVDFFFNSEQNERNENAYYVEGSTMKSTRFFYADAASQQAMGNTAGRKIAADDFFKMFGETLVSLNQLIKGLMSFYLAEK